MGMFTRIKKDNKVIQVKCGDDLCETYEIGDSVPFYVNPEEYGSASFADGAYDGVGESLNDPDTYWVIIKDSKIHSVLNENEIDCEIDPDESKYLQIEQYLKDKYELYQDLYSKECLAFKKKEEKERKIAHQKQIDEWKEQGLTDNEIFAKILCTPISISINYASLLSKL